MRCVRPGCAGEITGRLLQRVRDWRRAGALDGHPGPRRRAGPAGRVALERRTIPKLRHRNHTTEPLWIGAGGDTSGAGPGSRDGRHGGPAHPEDRRFCAGCNRAVGRSRGDVPGLTEGFCGKCRHPFSFSAKLRRGELVAGQYDVAGPIDHGGLGWIYLARDRRVADRWVALKGLINRGDAVAMGAALAERRSLAEVEHPNIVKIHNFVEHDGDGYIVMEYVNGLSLSKVLDARREANDNQPKPLPVELAIEYILEVLPGHRAPSRPRSPVLRLQAVQRRPDRGRLEADRPRRGVPHGRAGRAPFTGQPATWLPRSPTPGRPSPPTCSRWRGRSSSCARTSVVTGAPTATRCRPRRTSSSSRDTTRSIASCERATAADPAERFQSAEEMAEQLLGVQREVVAEQHGAPCPGPSTRFTPERRGSTAAADWRTLPVLLVNPDDPGSAVVESVAATEPEALIEMLHAIPDRSVETELRLARALVEAGRLEEASTGTERDRRRGSPRPATLRTGESAGIEARARSPPARPRQHGTTSMPCTSPSLASSLPSWPWPSRPSRPGTMRRRRGGTTS